MNREDTPVLFITLRFLLVLVLSIVLIFVDVRLKLLSDFRYYVETTLYPIFIFADSPHSVSEVVSSQFKTRAELLEENERLSTENYMQRVDIMRLRSLEQENAAMRKLLNSPLRVSSRRMFAEVISVDSDPYLQRVVVNRGASSGVYAGMPVITDEGLVGQVVSVAYATSRVLLFSDPSSAIPVTNTRNQVRAILSGTGIHDELVIENIPRSTDIKEGDLLVTSGLGGVYPEGYPVAIVSSVGFSDDQPFAEVKAKPLVDTDKIRYVLMFWYQPNMGNDSPLAPVKEQTDGKRILRQERIRQLIDALTDDDRLEGRSESNAQAVGTSGSTASGVSGGGATRPASNNSGNPPRRMGTTSNEGGATTPAPSAALPQVLWGPSVQQLQQQQQLQQVPQNGLQAQEVVLTVVSVSKSGGPLGGEHYA